MMGRAGFSRLELAVAASLILLLGGVALPTVSATDRYAQKQELITKGAEIQDAIERYYLDHKPGFPTYLIGGEAAVDERGNPRPETASDPLIRGGYLVRYPKNPFLNQGKGFLYCQKLKDDPLREGDVGSEGSYPRGLRFGRSGMLMGQVLAEHRYPSFLVEIDGESKKLSSFAKFSYEQFDTWEGERGRNREGFYVGSFAYKSGGPAAKIVSRLRQNPRVPLGPIQPEHYILLIFGYLDDEGSDLLGREPTIGEGGPPSWTRGSMTKPEGSPFLKWDELGDFFGWPNPNGISDGVIWMAYGMDEERNRRWREKMREKLWEDY